MLGRAAEVLRNYITLGSGAPVPLPSVLSTRPIQVAGMPLAMDSHQLTIAAAILRRRGIH